MMTTAERMEMVERIDARVLQGVNWAYYRERLEALGNELWSDVDIQVGDAVRQEMGLPEHDEGLEYDDHVEVHDSATAGHWEALLRSLAQLIGGDGVSLLGLLDDRTRSLLRRPSMRDQQ